MRGTCFTKPLVAAAVVTAAVAFGANVDASLTGLIQSRPVISAGEAQTVVPFFAQVGLNASDINLGPVQDIRVGLGAWGRVSLTNEQAAGDVDLAFVSGKLFDKRLTVTLGRQFRAGGAFRALHVDGASVDVALPGRLGVTAFGGLPVIPRFAAARGDAVWGARLYWRPNWDTEIGASYFEMMDHGYTARRDVGIDGRTELFRHLNLSGLAVLSAVEGRLVEAEISPGWRVSDQVEIVGQFRHTSPDLLLPRTSILSVFAQTVHNHGGLGVAYDPTTRFSASLDAKLIGAPNEPLGYELSGMATVRPLRTTRATLQAVRLGLPENGYTRVRLAGGHTMGLLTLSLDLDGYFLDQPVNGVKQSFTVAATGRLALPLNFDVVVSGLYATDPFFQSRFEVIGRLVYTFHISTRSADEKREERKAGDEKKDEKDEEKADVKKGSKEDGK